MRIDVVSASSPISASQQNTAAAVTVEASVQQEVATVGVEQNAVTSQLAVQRVQMEAAEAERSQALDDSSLLTQEDIEKLVKQGNNLFDELRLNEQFQLRQHDKLPRTLIRLIDVRSDRVIREYPPSKYLDLVAALQELSGIMLDERV